MTKYKVKKQYHDLFHHQFKTPFTLNNIKNELSFEEELTKTKKSYFGMYIVSTFQFLLCMIFVLLAFEKLQIGQTKSVENIPTQLQPDSNFSLVYMILAIFTLFTTVSTLIILKKRKDG